MIEIVKGTYGHFDGRKITPVTKADGPQNWDPSLEASLVARGIAKYVGETEKPAEAPTEDNTAVLETEEVELSAMSVKQLREIATRMGLDLGGMRKKADIIAAIEGAAPPTFDATESIV